MPDSCKGRTRCLDLTYRMSRSSPIRSRVDEALPPVSWQELHVLSAAPLPHRLREPQHFESCETRTARQPRAEREKKWHDSQKFYASIECDLLGGKPQQSRPCTVWLLAVSFVGGVRPGSPMPRFTQPHSAWDPPHRSWPAGGVSTQGRDTHRPSPDGSHRKPGTTELVRLVSSFRAGLHDIAGEDEMARSCRRA
ncbi:hypothetical protein VTK56DRAFT_3757 [Thermocarpiscus australiensis]